MTTTSPPTTQRRALVSCEAAGEPFALDVQRVERVLRYSPPRHVPSELPWLRGVLTVNGRLLPVLDLRERLGLAETAADDNARILVLALPDGPVGFVVDAVHEVLEVPADALRAAPAAYRGLARRYVDGIVEARERLHLVLNAAELVTSTERLVLQAATAAAAGETNG